MVVGVARVGDFIVVVLMPKMIASLTTLSLSLSLSRALSALAELVVTPRYVCHPVLDYARRTSSEGPADCVRTTLPIVYWAGRGLTLIHACRVRDKGELERERERGGRREIR